MEELKNLYLKESKKKRIFFDLALRLNELNKSQTDLRNKIDALKQIISHIEELKKQVKIKTKKIRKENQKPS